MTEDQMKKAPFESNNERPTEVQPTKAIPRAIQHTPSLSLSKEKTKKIHVVYIIKLPKMQRGFKRRYKKTSLCHCKNSL